MDIRGCASVSNSKNRHHRLIDHSSGSSSSLITNAEDRVDTLDIQTIDNTKLEEVKRP
jgi:hypothetical protein